MYVIMMVVFFADPGTQLQVNFENIKSFIKKNDVLIINDTKVKPTVINGKLNGKLIKITLLENVNDYFWKSFMCWFSMFTR